MVLCVKQNNIKNNSFVDTLKSATNRINLYIYIYIGEKFKNTNEIDLC